MSRRVVTFPHMGEYWIAFETLARELGAEPLVPPRMTKRTLEIGALHSPEFVCVPFKYNLGNFIEALDVGANVIVQAGGGCRFGYYAEVQEAILSDLGYEFEMINLTSSWRVTDFLADFRRIAPGASTVRVARAFAIAYRKGKALEAVEDRVRKNVGFEAECGAHDRIVERFLRDLRAADGFGAVAEVERRTLDELAAVPLDEPERRLRVGVVGELYVLMEPFANHHLERRLAEARIEVHRFITLTKLIEHGIRSRPHIRALIGEADPWVRYHLGADGTESVAMTWKLLKEGFDGMAHLKPFGCMPEVSAMSVLQRISREHTFPILSVSYDAQTAETGIRTRVEAFADMLHMRAQGRDRA
jgi:predicted nucleotide-binding protein (sugar kinase/HSP70/actin superfamily)